MFVALNIKPVILLQTWRPYGPLNGGIWLYKHADPAGL